MSITVNKRMATILGMDMSEDEGLQTEIVEVEPHEIVRLDNPDLPPTADIDRRQLQAEKQLEEIIQTSLGYQRELFDAVKEVEPKYRSRYIEVANGTLGLALDAIKVKLKTQLDTRKQRLDQAKFRTEGRNKENTGQTNNFFFGSREEILAQLKGVGVGEPVEEVPDSSEEE